MKFFAKDFKIIETPSEHRLPMMCFKIYKRESRQYVGKVRIHSSNIQSLQNILFRKGRHKDVYNFKDLNNVCAVEARIKSQRSS